MSEVEESRDTLSHAAESLDFVQDETVIIDSFAYPVELPILSYLHLHKERNVTA